VKKARKAKKARRKTKKAVSFARIADGSDLSADILKKVMTIVAKDRVAFHCGFMRLSCQAHIFKAIRCAETQKRIFMKVRACHPALCGSAVTRKTETIVSV
jgi:hypothetical protein